MNSDMKTRNILWAALCGVMLILGSCRGNQNVSESVSYYNFGTSYVNASPSGIVTIRSWGSGPDKSQAIEEAKKNAVYDMIFKGIKGAPKGYMSTALVNEVNARERYAEYFDRFFAKGGEYKKFVKETSGSDNSRVKSKSNGRENFGVTVNVDRPALQKQLREDGIIK